MIHVLALVPYATGCAPGQRYRIEQWADHLRGEGIDVTFSSFMSREGTEVLHRPGHVGLKARDTLVGHCRRLAEAVAGVRADVIFLYREATLLGPAYIERLLSWRRPIVYDFDDAIYLPDASAANAWTRALKPRGKAASICRLARHVTVGNDFLADFARRHARAVTVVPSTIDTEVYRLRTRPVNGRPVVGWTGSSTTLPHLLTLAPALRRLSQRSDFELRLIGAPGRIDGVRTRFVPWRAATETEDLAYCDVGLMPLPDNEWSRGKCGMKALQYMGLGIPPVVSPVGVNPTIVSDGVNGFHARNDDEWVEKIALLLRDAELRSRLGTEARRTVEGHFSALVHAPRIAQVLRDAAGRG